MNQPLPARLHGVIQSISVPFDADRLVEIKLFINHNSPCQGEMRIRVPAAKASQFAVGDEFSFKLTKVD